MKFYVLSENSARRAELLHEHGLSLWLECGDRHILFDMGQSDVFARNAAVMNVPLATADYAVLSHGHYDHGGGLETFLKINQHAPVYVQACAFGQFFNATGRDISLPCRPTDTRRVILCRDQTEIEPHLSLHSCNALPRIHPTNPWGLQKAVDGKRNPDDFQHEHYLLVEEQGKRKLISGCSHKGIVNILEWFRPDVLVGGLHLNKLELSKPVDREHLLEIVEILRKYGTVVYTGHCTGEAAYAFLKQRLEEQIHAIQTGDVFCV